MASLRPALPRTLPHARKPLRHLNRTQPPAIVLRVTARHRRPTVGEKSGLALYLSLHGIHAQIHAIDLGNRDIGHALTDTAERLKSDLIVMGAYGHSRLRERILGGATRGLLARS
ncbi:MAG TPA: universal stress protein, partial [Dongiaceae bacterium]|nr:universal stress protein [Dongiaceae bacterium]